MFLSPLADTTLTIASAVVTACVPIAVMKISSLFKLNLDQSHQASITSAVQTALGVGFQAVESCGISALTNPSTRAAAVNAIVGYVKQAAPEAVSKLNLSDDAIAQTVSAHIATMLNVASASGQGVTAVGAAVSAAAALAPAAVSVPTAAPAPAGA